MGQACSVFRDVSGVQVRFSVEDISSQFSGQNLFVWRLRLCFKPCELKSRIRINPPSFSMIHQSSNFSQGLRIGEFLNRRKMGNYSPPLTDAQ